MDGTGEKKLTNYLEAIEIENMHASQLIYISFSSDYTRYRTINVGETYTVTIQDPAKSKVREVHLWANGAATDCEIAIQVIN